MKWWWPLWAKECAYPARFVGGKSLDPKAERILNQYVRNVDRN